MRTSMLAICATSCLLYLSKVCQAADIKEDIKDDRVEYAVNSLRSIAEGLKLYDHVNGLTTCDWQTTDTFATMVDSVSVLSKSNMETDIVREGFWLFTDGLGLSSYAIRSCYGSYTSL